jgi:hypothetical protein
MRGGQPCYQRFAAAGQANFDLTAVVGRRLAIHEPPRPEPVDYAHGAVVLQVQPFREFANADIITLGKPLDDEQRLMLLGRDACGARGGLAEFQEAAEGEPPGRQGFVVAIGERGTTRHSGPAKAKTRNLTTLLKYIAVRYK